MAVPVKICDVQAITAQTTRQIHSAGKRAITAVEEHRNEGFGPVGDGQIDVLVTVQVSQAQESTVLAGLQLPVFFEGAVAPAGEDRDGRRTEIGRHHVQVSVPVEVSNPGVVDRMRPLTRNGSRRQHFHRPPLRRVLRHNRKTLLAGTQAERRAIIMLVRNHHVGKPVLIQITSVDRVGRASGGQHDRRPETPSPEPLPDMQFSDGEIVLVPRAASGIEQIQTPIPVKILKSHPLGLAWHLEFDQLPESTSRFSERHHHTTGLHRGQPAHAHHDVQTTVAVDVGRVQVVDMRF